VAETIELVKDYVRQETLGPLRGAGRWIGLGLLGAVLIGLGTAFLALGSLRMVQTEWADTFSGRWMSLVPYLIAFVFCLIVVALALSRVNTRPLSTDRADDRRPGKEPR
jgi:hypothetical protein